MLHPILTVLMETHGKDKENDCFFAYLKDKIMEKVIKK